MYSRKGAEWGINHQNSNQSSSAKRDKDGEGSSRGLIHMQPGMAASYARSQQSVEILHNKEPTRPFIKTKQALESRERAFTLSRFLGIPSNYLETCNVHLTRLCPLMTRAYSAVGVVLLGTVSKCSTSMIFFRAFLCKQWQASSLFYHNIWLLPSVQ